FDGPQPAPSNEVAARVDDAPVDGEPAGGRGVVPEDARLSRDAGAVRLGGDEKIHRRLDAVGDVRADDDLARRLVGEVAEGRARGDVEERLVVAGVEDALRSLPPPSADGHEHLEERDLVGAY